VGRYKFIQHASRQLQHSARSDTTPVIGSTNKIWRSPRRCVICTPCYCVADVRLIRLALLRGCLKMGAQAGSLAVTDSQRTLTLPRLLTIFPPDLVRHTQFTHCTLA